MVAVTLVACGHSDEPHNKDRTAEKAAIRTPGYPLAGFWKQGTCRDHFGLAIAPAGEQMYSVSYCGPRGCFKPGSYRPNTRIVDDPLYKVIDNDTIDTKVVDGFSRYVRCPGR